MSRTDNGPCSLFFTLMSARTKHPAPEENLGKEEAEDKESWWQPALLLFARLSSWVVVPVLLATLLGRWLDRRFDTAPWGLVVIVGFAFIISMYGLVREAGREYGKIEGKGKDGENGHGRQDW